MALQRVPDWVGRPNGWEVLGHAEHLPAPGALEEAELPVSPLHLGHLRPDGTPRVIPLTDPSLGGKGGGGRVRPSPPPMVPKCPCCAMLCCAGVWRRGAFLWVPRFLVASGGVGHGGWGAFWWLRHGNLPSITPLFDILCFIGFLTRP